MVKDPINSQTNFTAFMAYYYYLKFNAFDLTHL